MILEDKQCTHNRPHDAITIAIIEIIKAILRPSHVVLFFPGKRKGIEGSHLRHLTVPPIVSQ